MIDFPWFRGDKFLTSKQSLQSGSRLEYVGPTYLHMSNELEFPSLKGIYMKVLNNHTNF